MTTFIIRKFLQGVLLIAVVLVINFFILRLTPGNPYDAQRYTLLAENNGRDLTARQQLELEQLKNRLGIYYDPAPQAFLTWAGGIVRFDFGVSVISGLNITASIIDSAVSSLWLLLFATLFGLILGVGLGLFAAYHPNSWQDNAIKIFALLFIALPGWYMYDVLSKLNQQFLQITGTSFIPQCQNRAGCQPINPNTFLPIFLLGSILLALFWGQTRTQAVSVLNQDYVRTAHAKGLRGQRIVLRHVLRNSLNPIISIFGGLLPFVFASQILIESKARWAGLGSAFLGAAQVRDYTYLMGVFTFLVLICVLCNFLAEVAQAWLDPKIREQYQGGASLAKVALPSKVKTGWRRPVPIGVGLGLAFAIIAGLVLLNPLADKTVPTTDNASQAITASPSTASQAKIVYEAKLPNNAKILQTDIKSGVRKPVVAYRSKAGQPTGKPPFNNEVESKQTIFSTQTRGIPMMVEYRKVLEADGWSELEGYNKYLTITAVDYVFEKGDKLLWIASYDTAGSVGQNNWELFKVAYPVASKGMGIRVGDTPNTIGAVIEGYKAGKSPSSNSNP